MRACREDFLHLFQKLGVEQAVCLVKNEMSNTAAR